jgi:hypothetical protein
MSAGGIVWPAPIHLRCLKSYYNIIARIYTGRGRLSSTTPCTYCSLKISLSLLKCLFRGYMISQKSYATSNHRDRPEGPPSSYFPEQPRVLVLCATTSPLSLPRNSFHDTDVPKRVLLLYWINAEHVRKTTIFPLPKVRSISDITCYKLMFKRS